MPVIHRSPARMSRLRVAVIGAGQMGMSHARVVAGSDAAELAVVVDQDPAAASRVAGQYGGRPSGSIEDVRDVDAVIVATSTAHHLECGLPFIEAGLPTFIEKPLAPGLADVRKIIDIAARRDVPVMCGFVERFNAALRTASEALTEPPTHVLTVRHSPPAPRIASSVIADMLLHDLDVVVNLFDGRPATLAGAAWHRPPGSEWAEIADCTLVFDHGLANLSANRMGQRKVRSLTIHSATQLVEVDLLRQDVTIYRNVSQEMVRAGGGVGYRSSTEVEIPFVRHVGEPLVLQFAHFVELARGTADHDAERMRILPAHELIEAVEAAGHLVAPAVRPTT